MQQWSVRLSLVRSVPFVIVGLGVLLTSATDTQAIRPPWVSGISWDKPAVVTPGDDNAPPSDAIILFDGTDMSAWEHGEKWKIENGYGVCASSVRTKQSFGDCQLHIEWASPADAKGVGQSRGNSGIYFMGKYEIQILDSYQNETYFDGQSGAMYKQRPPLVNACRKPGEWQSYDIVFRAPHFDDDGKLLKPAYITAFHNGLLIQDHYEIVGVTDYRTFPQYHKHSDKGPISLQYHGTPVRFRNIWIRELESTQDEKLNGLRAMSRIGKPRVFIMDSEQLFRARYYTQTEENPFTEAIAKLTTDADQALELKPPSVMDKRMTPPSGDKHDYMSQGGYWWPNPDTENGLPYIRKDGEFNPECNEFDSRPMGRMTHAVNTLALAYFYTGKEAYAAKAAELLRVWFLNPGTKMNPHLQYGQAIPGRCEGRDIGIVDTSRLTGLVDSVGLLHGSPSWTADDQKALQTWFDAYLTWLLGSKHGRSEATQPNNHATFYDVQVVTFALFVGRNDVAKETLEQVGERRFATQIEPDGTQPWELRRTKAWGYSIGNTIGMLNLARLGEHFELDLWHYQSPDGASLRKAIDWLAAYADGSKSFDYKQISGMNYERLAPVLRRAALAYDEPAYEAMIDKLPDVKLSDDRMQLMFPPKLDW